MFLEEKKTVEIENEKKKLNLTLQTHTSITFICTEIHVSRLSVDINKTCNRYE